MKKSGIVSLLLILVGAFHVYGQQWSWLKDQGEVIQWPESTQITGLSNGDVISLTQYEFSQGSFTSQRTMLRRTDPAGAVIWQDSAGGFHPAIQILGDHTGNFLVISNYDYWLSGGTVFPADLGTMITCIDGNGTRQWCRLLKGIAARMTIDWNGDILVLEHGKNFGEWIIERLDAQGNEAGFVFIPFSPKTTAIGLLELRDIAVDQTGNIHVCGYFTGDSIRINNGITFVSSSHADAFLLKFNDSLSLLSAEFIRGIAPWRMQSDKNNNLMMLLLSDRDTVQIRNKTVIQQYGNNYSNISYYLAKIDQGGCDWVKEIQRYGLFDDDLYYDMRVMPGGELYVTGKTLGNMYLGNTLIPMSTGVFVIRADSSGNFVWGQQAFCSSATFNCHDIDVCSNGAVYVSGIYKDTLTGGQHQLSAGYRYFLGSIADGALTTGLKENYDREVRPDLVVFPNPADNIVNFSGGVSSYEILDSRGRQVMKGSTAETGRLDVSDLSPGLYHLKLSSGSGLMTKKLLIR